MPVNTTCDGFTRRDAVKLGVIRGDGIEPV